MMRHHIERFCAEFEYPAEAVDALLTTYDAVAQVPAFSQLIDAFWAGEDTVVPALDAIADTTSVCRYTLYLLFFVCLARDTRKHYAEAGIPDEIYRESMTDLKWKLLECMQVHGVAGTFVPTWFPDFFRRKRFALGRLQFEKIDFYRDTPPLHKGDPVLNVHIPSAGPLTVDACMDSFRRAYAFYRDSFEDPSIVFLCHSWLLYPGNTEFLPKDSNILKFANLFQPIDSWPDEKGTDLWRIFGADWKNPPETLPRNTSIQRALADRLAAGKGLGMGVGILVLDETNL